MEDDNFWHLGGVTRWNSQILIHTWTFLAVIFVASYMFLCLFWISLWLRIGVYNTLASEICVKLLKPPKIQIPTPNTDFLTHSWFHSMLFALPGYQFPYTVMDLSLSLKTNTVRSYQIQCIPKVFMEICPTYTLALTLKYKLFQQSLKKWSYDQGDIYANYSPTKLAKTWEHGRRIIQCDGGTVSILLKKEKEKEKRKAKKLDQELVSDPDPNFLHLKNISWNFVLLIPWPHHLNPYVEDWGPLHTWDWEPVTITPQALSLVGKAEPVQVRFTLCLRDQRSMWMPRWM
jgi:hypothetical protein